MGGTELDHIVGSICGGGRLWLGAARHCSARKTALLVDGATCAVDDGDRRIAQHVKGAMCCRVVVSDGGRCGW